MVNCEKPQNHEIPKNQTIACTVMTKEQAQRMQTALAYVNVNTESKFSVLILLAFLKKPMHSIIKRKLNQSN